MKNLIPIFVISYNRGEYLRKIINSYKKQDIPVAIIIHDNGSDEKKTIEILNELENEGYTIYRKNKIYSPDELNLVNDTVVDYFSRAEYSTPYAVTDCDVDLSEARPDTLRLYLELLDTFTNIECVGPMLRISDVCKSYPLFNRVMERHIEQFWRREPEWTSTSLGSVAFLRHAIDTTFAIHRANSVFRRLKPGLRIYHPFEATHLDWYVSEKENSFYRQTSSDLISHWNNSAEFERFKSNDMINLSYITVHGELPDLKLRYNTTLDHPD